ncbi:MAG: (E)-4-hydroxy-3-methylbut-2-enyl-diphosphate synthase, partial [Bacteroidota bacterium]
MTERYRSRTFAIGNLQLGGDEPVCIQSMTNTDTNDVEASVNQCRRMIEAGAQMVRLTTQGKREVSNLSKIRKALHSMGFQIPLVADIHFKPALAIEAARVTDKIRINPGNYLKGKSPGSLLPELLEICREFGTTIRIGVNHGSLDESILNEYGDTPAGMVESAMQFLRVCKEQAFDNVVVSMKSSNPRVMVQSVRLLAYKMELEEMWYPLHLGVTEAGDGLQGRIKSAVGMAPLLLEGMGDTLRVSLTEPPEEEMPVASKIVELFPKPTHLPYNPFHGLAWDPFSFNRRKSQSVAGIGNGTMVKIISNTPPDPKVDISSDSIMGQLVSYKQWQQNPGLLEKGDRLLLLEQSSLTIQEIKLQLNRFCTHNQSAPIIFKTSHHTEDP